MIKGYQRIVDFIESQVRKYYLSETA